MMLTFGRSAMRKATRFLRIEQTTGRPMVRRSRRSVRSVLAAWMASFLLLSGCTVGPKYARPTILSPTAYKELTPSDYSQTDGWKSAQPKDDALRGNWWEMFGDPQLDALEEQVSISNQNIAAATSNFLVARALVKEARAAFFPTISTSPAITNSRTSTSGNQYSAARGTPATYYSMPYDASYVPDLWGKIRNTVKSNVYNAQASAADLENARLTAQADLAVDYFDLRRQDALKQLYDETVAAYTEYLKLTQARFETGIDSDETVAQAETQLETAQAEATNLGILRAQYEHAIATLIGKNPSTFSLPVQSLTTKPPAVPIGVPSQLLERRPDIAAAERLVAQANAQIGIAKAAYFPTLTLSADAGFNSSSIGSWLSWPSGYWSVGPMLAETIFDGGLRKATVEQHRATYDADVANYRQTVLTAFQQVEDELATLRILSQQIQKQDAAVQSAQRYLTIATDRYKLGIDPYLNVITAQESLLSNRQTLTSLRTQQVTASVQLIEALGGGWDASQLPSPGELAAKSQRVAP
jgi:NodT family efflux transporter outer membrane factor (OMF) lipoprotein